ncbi:hypothetical protein C8R45DRAFT_931216 [Mycena sanguinolenta]|nr:hypothetical protein C8R45DRAFT_931216 [Mycena sanguinolenta]
MISLQTLIGLAIGAWMAFLGIHAQCLQNAGYLGGYDAYTGAFVGAVAIDLVRGVFTLDTSGDPSNYLGVIVFSTRIISPANPTAGYVSLICGTTLCSECTFTGFNPFVAMTAADGNPLGPFPTPGLSQNAFAGGYGSLQTGCGESQVWVLGGAVGRQVLVPSWRDPSGSESGPELPVRKLTEFEPYTRTFSFCWMRHETNVCASKERQHRLYLRLTHSQVIMAANAATYSAGNSATVRQLQLSIVF